MSNIKCYHCKGNHSSVQQVKNCSQGGTLQSWKNEQAAAEAKYPTLVPTPFQAAEAANPVLSEVLDNPLKWALENMNMNEPVPAAPVAVPAAKIPAHRLVSAWKAPVSAVEQAAQAAGAIKVQISAEAVANATPASPEAVKAFQTGGFKALLEQKKAENAAVKTGQDLELGMYQLVIKGEVVIFKVKFNKAGTHKFAEKLYIEGGFYGDKPKGKFYYAVGMMAKLTSENKMTEEQAKAFHDATKVKYGQAYGFCCVCGKLLTVKKSIDAGIGPVCATKF